MENTTEMYQVEKAAMKFVIHELEAPYEKSPEMLNALSELIRVIKEG